MAAGRVPEQAHLTVIVVGVEGSPDSRLALRWAIDEARVRKAVLRVVHAYQTVGGPGVVERLDRHARQVVDAAVRDAGDMAPEVAMLPELARNESAASALLSRAEEADLLVVGCRGLGGFTGLLVGSVSDQCVHHAPCPVAIIRQPAGACGHAGGRHPAVDKVATGAVAGDR